MPLVERSMNNLTKFPWQTSYVKRLSKEALVNNIPQSAWRTAYASALFETDQSKMPLRISDTRAAIAERLLNSPVEISGIEHKSIEAARQGLVTLKTERAVVPDRKLT